MKCQNCGGDIPINQRYCAICGNKVEVSFDFITDSVQVDASARRGRQYQEGMKFFIALLLILLILAYLYNSYRSVTPVADVEPYVPAPAAPTEAAAFEVTRFDPLKGIPEPKVDIPSFGRAGPRRYGFRAGAVKEALVEARGGDAQTKSAVAKGLAWLAASQAATPGNDGRWSVGFNGGRAKASDSGVTGLAVLAFLADGHVWVPGPDGKARKHGKTAMKGVHWLLQGQTPAGLLGNPGDSKHNYSHAMATMALAEAYAMSGDMRLRPPLEKAVKFVVAGQRPSGGWNYTNDPKSTRADTSVTGWQVMALVSARRAGVAVPEDTLKSASNWFESVTDSRTAMTGYEVNPSAERGKAVTRKYHSTTAISLLCRQSMPLDQDQRLLRRQANVLLDTPPEWSRGWQIDTCRKRVDLYYWYHGTEALFLIGGLQWERWNASLKRALLTTQETRGYWPGHTLWGLDGGRVFTTSLAVLCLTTYYRHP